MRNQLKKDPRSIWNRARRVSRLSRADINVITELIADESQDIYDEIQRTEDDLRDSMPEDNSALLNDIESLENRVTELEELG